MRKSGFFFSFLTALNLDDFYEKLSKCVQISAVKTRPLLILEEMSVGKPCFWARNFSHAEEIKISFVSLTIAQAILSSCKKNKMTQKKKGF